MNGGELLYGPEDRLHLRAVMWLTRNLVPQLADDHILSPQQAIALPALRSMPEPDIAVLDVAEVMQRTAQHPRLLIEVSDSSLRFDRITKSRLYARGGISEYWLVNVGEQTVEVHREPTGIPGRVEPWRGPEP